MAKQIKWDCRLMGIRAAAALAFMLIIAGGMFLSIRTAHPGELFRLILFAAAILAFVVALWPFPYWCPQCHKRLRIMQEKRPKHVYHCHACDVDWDIGSSDD